MGHQLLEEIHARPSAAKVANWRQPGVRDCLAVAVGRVSDIERKPGSPRRDGRFDQFVVARVDHVVEQMLPEPPEMGRVGLYRDQLERKRIDEPQSNRGAGDPPPVACSQFENRELPFADFTASRTSIHSKNSSLNAGRLESLIHRFPLAAGCMLVNSRRVLMPRKSLVQLTGTSSSQRGKVAKMGW